MVEITFKSLFLLSQSENRHCIQFYILVLYQVIVLSKILCFFSVKDELGTKLVQILFVI